MSASFSTPMTARSCAGFLPHHTTLCQCVCFVCLADTANLCVGAHDPGRSLLVCSPGMALPSPPDLNRKSLPEFKGRYRVVALGVTSGTLPFVCLVVLVK